MASLRIAGNVTSDQDKIVTRPAGAFRPNTCRIAAFAVCAWQISGVRPVNTGHAARALRGLH
jgi:hypothetical protein